MIDFMDKILKEIGANDANQTVKDWLSTGYLPLNKAISGRYDGGFPVGRITEIFGGESCLDADTFINYCVVDSNGNRQNKKGGTIEHLYNRFHSIVRLGQGNYQRTSTVNSNYLLASVNDDGFILKNRIIDVVKTGEKECFEVVTANGLSIRATKEHRFWDGSEFVELKDLSIGSTVYVHVNTPYKPNEPAKIINRVEWFVKHHPLAADKVVDGKYIYKRITLTRAVYEAHMNRLELEKYREKLNSGDLEGLVFLPKGEHIHHVDENCNNNSIENLMVVSATDHGKLHMKTRLKNFSFVATPDTIESINSVGLKDTYDIKMADPYRNFIADKFVVHNSGKTLLATMAMIETQRRGGLAIFLDFEHSFSMARAKALGLSDDRDKWIYKQPESAEKGFKLLEFVANEVRKNDSDKFITCIPDSVASMLTEAELAVAFDETNMKTRLSLPAVMSESLKKLAGLVSNTNISLLFLNQTRANVGVLYGAKEKTTGGNALKFYASTRIKLTRGEKIKESKDGDKIIGERVTAQIIKNKVFEPWRSVQYDGSFTEGIDLEGSHIADLKERGVLGDTKGWLIVKDQKFRQADLVKACKENPALYQEILREFYQD